MRTGPPSWPDCLDCGRIDKCPRWSTLWVNPISPGRGQASLFKFSPSHRVKCFVKPRGNTVRSMSWVCVNFGGRWETILLEELLQLCPWQRWDSRSGCVSHLSCSFHSPSPSLYAVVGHLPNAAEGSQPCLEYPSWKVWMETPTTTAQVRSAIQVPLGEPGLLKNHSQTLNSSRPRDTGQGDVSFLLNNSSYFK